MLVLYILLRNDMESLTGSNFNRVGKAVAQGSHAANQMVYDARLSNDIKTMVEQWSTEASGFGTCIVLSVNEFQMRSAVALSKSLGIHSGIIHDPTYPIQDGGTFHLIPLDTCAYVFGYKNELKPVVGSFSLMP